jgi:hypothetical protein
MITLTKGQLVKLAEIYNKDIHTAAIVATVCDEVLDKSGGLLGTVRALAEMYNKYE